MPVVWTEATCHSEANLPSGGSDTCGICCQTCLTPSCPRARYWRGPTPQGVGGKDYTESYTLPHQNVINVIAVLSIWSMPGPSSGCFAMTKSVRQQKIVNCGKLQKSEPFLIGVVTAEGLQMPCQFLAQQECSLSVSSSMTFCSWSKQCSISLSS